MLERFEKRIEEGLEKIVASCRKRKQLPAAVGQRVGRLLGQNSRAAGAFEVQIDPDVDGFAKCHWKRIDRWREWARLSEGCYVLRSNVTDRSPEELWRAYMQLTEAEAAFRIQKTDLQLRPIWHQKQERVEAQILVAFWPLYCGRRWRNFANAPGWAMNRGKYSRSWRTSHWSTLCYRRETE